MGWKLWDLCDYSDMSGFLRTNDVPLMFPQYKKSSIKKEEMNELKELPARWCIKQNLSEEVCDWFNRIDSNVVGAYTEGSWDYLCYDETTKVSDYKDAHEIKFYKEITLLDFKRLVLKEPMEKQIKLSLEVAQKMYNSGDDAMKAFALENYTKNELEPKKEVKKWEDLKEINGHYIESNARISDVYNRTTYQCNKNIFATSKQAKSALAFAQLTQLMALEEQISEKEYGDEDVVKYCIYRYQNRITTSAFYEAYQFLAFKTSEARDKFLSNHEQLIREYFMLD